MHRDRMADRAQHRQVRLRVRVRPRRREVDSLALGQLADRLRLALAVRERPAGAARVVPVDDLGHRADGAVERQHDRHQLGHLLRRRGADEDRPAGVLVLVRDRQHARIQAREHAREHVRRQPLEVAHPHTLEQVRDPLAQRVGAGVGRAAQAEEEVLPRVARDLATRDQTRLVRRAAELERRRARHQRAVEIEERRALLVRPPQRAAPGRRREDVRPLRHTWFRSCVRAPTRRQPAPPGKDAARVQWRSPCPDRGRRQAVIGGRLAAWGCAIGTTKPGRSPRRPDRRRSRSRRSRSRRRAGAARERARRGSARRRRRSGGRWRRRRR